MKSLGINVFMASLLLFLAWPVHAKHKKLRKSKQQNVIKVPFNQLFVKNTDGSFTPRQPLVIHGVTVKPGMRLTKGISFAGVDISILETKLLVIDTSNGSIKLK